MKVEIYGKAWCAYCDRAKDLLTEKKQDYVFHDIEASAQHHAEMAIRAPGAKTVPQIFVDDKLVGGYDELRKMYKSLTPE